MIDIYNHLTPAETALVEEATIYHGYCLESALDIYAYHLQTAVQGSPIHEARPDKIADYVLVCGIIAKLNCINELNKE